jgi:hypothetical protein
MRGFNPRTCPPLGAEVDLPVVTKSIGKLFPEFFGMQKNVFSEVA